MKQMQQTGVVRVFGVLGIEFPVRFNMLPGGAQKFHRFAEYPLCPAGHLFTQVISETHHFVIKGSEHQPFQSLHPQPLQTVIRHIEIFGIAALTPQAAAKRHAD